MNLIILQPDMMLSADRARLSQRQHQHIVDVLRCGIGSPLSVGMLNGGLGEALIIEQSATETILAIAKLDRPSPPALPITLILGLPRPRMLQRTLQTIATMGVTKLYLIQSSRVEKSFWQTPLLKPESVREQLLIGLEQAKATQLPEVHYFPRFRPFIEDVLPGELDRFHSKLIAHPGDFAPAQSVNKQTTVLAVGPEGGFIEKEFAGFCDLGFQPIQLGQRILRVETAVPVLLAKLF